MAELDDKCQDQIRDHLKVAEKVITLIEQLSRKPNSCDHTLVHGYAINALSRVKAASSLLAGSKKDRTHDQHSSESHRSVRRRRS